MSFDSIEGQRRDNADGVLVKFWAAIDKAERAADATIGDPWLKKLTAARITLEYTVLATAREKRVATEMVANALAASSTAQQAVMVKEGAAALGRAYQVEPEVLVTAFAGRLTDMTMPKGLASTPDIDKMVDSRRNLVAAVVKDEYLHRGRFTKGSDHGDSFIALQSDGIVSSAKSELAARLAFMESSIDGAVATGNLNGGGGGMLKERVEAQVFQPRPPQSLQFSKEFQAFYEQRVTRMRIEAMTEVHGVTTSRTVQEIAAKLKTLMFETRLPQRPADHRSHTAMERSR